MADSFNEIPESSTPEQSVPEVTHEQPEEVVAESPIYEPAEFDDTHEEVSEATPGGWASNEVQQIFEEANSGFEEQAALQDGNRIENGLAKHQHHFFPQEKHEALEEKGFSEAELHSVVDVDAERHRLLIHGIAASGDGDVNKRLDDFMTENPEASKAEIAERVKDIAISDGLNLEDAHIYNDWTTPSSPFTEEADGPVKDSADKLPDSN